MRQRMIDLPDELDARLRQLAATRGQSESQLIESALERYIEIVRDEDEELADPAVRAAILEAGTGMRSKPREFGSGAGMIVALPDSDEPLDDFKDYQ